MSVCSKRLKPVVLQYYGYRRELRMPPQRLPILLYPMNLIFSHVFKGLPLSSTPLPPSSTPFRPTANKVQQEQLTAVRMAPNKDSDKEKVKVKYVSARSQALETAEAYSTKN